MIIYYNSSVIEKLHAKKNYLIYGARSKGKGKIVIIPQGGWAHFYKIIKIKILICLG